MIITSEFKQKSAVCQQK